MPGWYGHDITLDLHLDDFEEISLPGEFMEVADCVNNEIREINNTLEGSLPDIVDQLAIDSQQLQQEALVGYDSIITGELFNGIQITGGGNSASIGTDLFYAQYVNDGRGPVTAKNKKCLHFITKDGTEVFTKSVGPAAARPYVEDSDEELGTIIDELVTEVIEAVI
ncbi:MAG: hypothetical protein BZ136_07450 [Methanosphaera sp. rholeuAM74]|nr:MAG: hypothetical protein BZ136_07450 [Methanosphaera sp. rholeuAM74]